MKRFSWFLINEFKNSRYIEALEAQIKELSTQLKQLKQEPNLTLQPF